MILIKNGTLHFADRDPVKGLDILVKDDRIEQIAENISAAGAKVLDASGKEVFAGFILPVTSAGLSDMSLFTMSDANESIEPINPGLHVRHSIDSREVALQNYHRCGITAFGAAPGPNALIAGRMGVYHTVGRHAADMCIKETVALKVNFTNNVKRNFKERQKAPMTRMGMAAMLREAFYSAKEYDVEKNGVNEDMEVLRQALSGELPLLVNVETAAEIETVLAIAGEFGLRVILHGAYAIGSVPELVKDVSVLLGDLHFAGAWIEHEMDLPGVIQMKRDGLLLGLSNSGDSSNGGECLLWDAAEMVKAGMDAEEAARTLSIDAARILGVDDVTGSLEEGKLADIAVFSGNPFVDYRASAEFCLSGGRISSDKEFTRCC